jgi:hypothetical protein
MIEHGGIDLEVPPIAGTRARAPNANAPIPLPAYYVAIVAGMLALLSANPLLTLGCVLTLLILARLLWRPGEPPVLLFTAGYQWIQVSTLVFVADYGSQPITKLSGSAQVESAIWLSLCGLIVLATGMRLGVRRLELPDRTKADRQLRDLSVDRVFGLYILSALFAVVAPYVAWRILPLAQILLILGNIKWAFYILLGYATLRRRTKIGYLVIATLLEFLAGIGFFAEFKTVFFVLALVLTGLQVKLSLRTLFVGTALGVLVVIAGIGWMGIREEYRTYLNQGTGQQVVLVTPVEQVKVFAQLVGDLDEESVSGSVAMMLKRIAYVDFFAAVLDYVPKQRAHENGALLWQAITHVLVPRFLYPNKPVLESDSEITIRYTGLSVASGDQGTSIGIGYMGEAYVDFGRVGMHFPIFAFGLLWGFMYSWMVRNSGLVVTGLAFASVLLLSANQFEIAQVKLLGGMLARFIVLALILRRIMPSLHAWMRGVPRHDPELISPIPIGSN